MQPLSELWGGGVTGLSGEGKDRFCSASEFGNLSFETKANSEILVWARHGSETDCSSSFAQATPLCPLPHVNQPPRQTGYRCHNGFPVLEELPISLVQKEELATFPFCLDVSLNHPPVLKMKKPAAELVLKLCVLKAALILMVIMNYPG